MAIDLDAARAARIREAKKEPVEVIWSGKTFTLPVSLSFPTLLAIKNISDPESVLGVLSKLLGPDQYEQFMGDQEPDQDDILTLLTALMSEYGLSVEKVEASSGS